MTARSRIFSITCTFSRRSNMAWPRPRPGSLFLRRKRNGESLNGSNPLVRARSRRPQGHRELRGERFTHLCSEAGEPDHRSPSSLGDFPQARVNHARTGTRYRSRALDPALPHYLPCARSRLLYSRCRPYEPGSVRIHTTGRADWGTVVLKSLRWLQGAKSMRLGSRLVAFLACSFAGIMIAADAPPSVPAIVLRPSRVFGGISPEAHEGWVVVVCGERIEAAGPAGEVKVPEGARVIELPGTTLLPGLIDAHTHVLLHPYNEALWSDQVLKEALALRVCRATNHLKNILLSGFTTIRDLGTEGAGYADVGLKQAVEQGIIPGRECSSPPAQSWQRGLTPPRGLLLSGTSLRAPRRPTGTM